MSDSSSASSTWTVPTGRTIARQQNTPSAPKPERHATAAAQESTVTLETYDTAETHQAPELPPRPVNIRRQTTFKDLPIPTRSSSKTASSKTSSSWKIVFLPCTRFLRLGPPPTNPPPRHRELHPRKLFAALDKGKGPSAPLPAGIQANWTKPVTPVQGESSANTANPLPSTVEKQAPNHGDWSVGG